MLETVHKIRSFSNGFTPFLS